MRSRKPYRRDMPEHSWIRNLKPGDVVESKGGNLRIVRRVSHCRDGRTSVYFVIARCSWTHRPYTVMGESDLITLGYRPINVNVPLDTDFDDKLQREFDRTCPPCIDCCDVRGIP